MQQTQSSRLLQLFVSSNSRHAGLIARVVLGVVMLPHGAQKLLGWFGGYGFSGTMQWFTGTMHVPWIFGFAAILAETLGALALLFGFATRLAALAVGAIFATAVALVHARHGFFMNWFGNQAGEGIEYFLFGGGLVAIVLVSGAGAWSVDGAIHRRLSRQPHHESSQSGEMV